MQFLPLEGRIHPGNRSPFQLGRPLLSKKGRRLRTKNFGEMEPSLCHEEHVADTNWLGILWVTWVKKHLIKNTNFWEVKERSNDSWNWKKDTQAVPHCAALQKMENWQWKPYISLAWYLVRPGTSFNLLLQRILMLSFNRTPWKALDCHYKRRMGMAERWRPASQGNIELHWTKNPLSQQGHSLFGGGTLLSPHTWNDLWARKTEVPWHKVVWFSDHIPQYSIGSWLALLDRLLTRQRTASWANIYDLACIYCNEVVEDTRYHFFSCRTNHTIWKAILNRLHVPQSKGPREVELQHIILVSRI